MSTKEHKEQEELHLDVRLIGHSLRTGKLSPKEYTEHLKRLPNNEERAEYIEVYTEPTPEDAPSPEKLTFT